MKKKKDAGVSEGPPVFLIREIEECVHLVYIDIPEMYEPVEYPMLIPPPPPWAIELLEYMRPYWLKSPVSYFLNDVTVDRWLKKEGYWGWWQQCWPLPLFRDYYRREYVEILLEQARSREDCPQNYLVLGYDVSVLQTLWKQTRQMKSLGFIVEELSVELEEWVEDFYQETGMTASVRQQHLPGVIHCTVPTMILDFSGVSGIPVCGVERGSIWLDMDSLEEKRRRIEERNTGITYFSMKKHWKGIDTFSKNRYNTEVN